MARWPTCWTRPWSLSPVSSAMSSSKLVMFFHWPGAIQSRAWSTAPVTLVPGRSLTSLKMGSSLSLMGSLRWLLGGGIEGTQPAEIELLEQGLASGVIHGLRRDLDLPAVGDERRRLVLAHRGQRVAAQLLGGVGELLASVLVLDEVADRERGLGALLGVLGL